MPRVDRFAQQRDEFVGLGRFRHEVMKPFADTA
jgi:hypothetical protein